MRVCVCVCVCARRAPRRRRGAAGRRRQEPTPQDREIRSRASISASASTGTPLEGDVLVTLAAVGLTISRSPLILFPRALLPVAHLCPASGRQLLPRSACTESHSRRRPNGRSSLFRQYHSQVTYCPSTSELHCRHAPLPTTNSNNRPRSHNHHLPSAQNVHRGALPSAHRVMTGWSRTGLPSALRSR
jgi:hypothetical protein